MSSHTDMLWVVQCGVVNRVFSTGTPSYNKFIKIYRIEYVLISLKYIYIYDIYDCF